MTEEELLAEEYICNGKCQDDITRNYVHCKTCTKLKDFLAGYKARKADLEKENAELKENLKKWKDAIYADVENYDDQLTKAKVFLEQLVSEITVGELEVDPNILQQAENFLKDN